MENDNDLVCFELMKNSDIVKYSYCGKITIEDIRAYFDGEFSGTILDLSNEKSANTIFDTQVVNTIISGNMDGYFRGIIIIDPKDEHQDNTKLLSYLKDACNHTELMVKSIKYLLVRLKINDSVKVVKIGVKTIGELVAILNNRDMDYLFDNGLRERIISELKKIGV